MSCWASFHEIWCAMPKIFLKQLVGQMCKPLSCNWRNNGEKKWKDIVNGRVSFTTSLESYQLANQMPIDMILESWGFNANQMPAMQTHDRCRVQYPISFFSQLCATISPWCKLQIKIFKSISWSTWRGLSKGLYNVQNAQAISKEIEPQVSCLVVLCWSNFMNIWFWFVLSCWGTCHARIIHSIIFQNKPNKYTPCAWPILFMNCQNW